jgi:CheY-like chemotaxis protein
MERISHVRDCFHRSNRFMSHVLIVEDDANAREALAMLAAGEGFTTAQAGSIEEARVQLVRQRPDVVLIDLRLPDGAGIDLIGDLEDREQHRDHPHHRACEHRERRRGPAPRGLGLPHQAGRPGAD